MKHYFIFLCLLISGGLAGATTQATINQDKPPYVYVKSYNMSDQASGTYHMKIPSIGSLEDESLTCNANFYGLIDGPNGLVGAGAADFQLQRVDQ